MTDKTQAKEIRISRRKLLLGTVAGIALASPLALITARQLFRSERKKKEPIAKNDHVNNKGYENPYIYPSESSPLTSEVARKPVEISIAGPFPCRKYLLKEPARDSWITIANIWISDFFGEGEEMLNIVYGSPEEKLFHCEMRQRITVTASDGKVYTLLDTTRQAFTGPWTDRTSHYTVVPSDSLMLPVMHNEIKKLDLQYIPV